ncbi:hypothetical protein IMZ31_23175 (plasmid) [Pontibacillus sp. ALD_SL1]|uniref:hypothetical protein n=1 Tax=Pontibacillus sp. ALD_SL1 TaxID=2777185 RepID=UPI001A959A11|nr:hypothetical protein [Pontibacillus sp. ALD_SL1]QST02356.1 hypothetical protein IMZ31_23175 [Pontibacillus sp. ALD_SL1]
MSYTPLFSITETIHESIKRWCNVKKVDDSDSLLTLSGGNNMLIGLVLLDAIETLEIPHLFNEETIFRDFTTVEDLIVYIADHN